MPATHTFAIFFARLNRAPVYMGDLRRSFSLPIPAEAPTFASLRALRGGNSPQAVGLKSGRRTLNATTK
jgi:hypothetical protein